MTVLYRNRVLVLDLRADRIGYAAFELPLNLLDYGASRFDSKKLAWRRVSNLLRTFRPSVIVLRRVRGRSTRRQPRWRAILRMIRRGAKKIEVPVAWVTDSALHAFYRQFECRNKFQVAHLLSRRFPELARKLPSQRKPYEPEPWTMTYFDAIALGVVHLTGGEADRLPEKDRTLSSAPHQLA